MCGGPAEPIAPANRRSERTRSGTGARTSGRIGHPVHGETPATGPITEQLPAMTDYRVKFDFVVHFTNGGSLSAQDFRLDIPGQDISDDALAAYLIQDMRLLMAGRVDISNKQIIAEPHKRGAIATTGLPQATIDLARHDLSAADLLAQAKDHPLRVVAADGESYKVSRLVV